MTTRIVAPLRVRWRALRPRAAVLLTAAVVGSAACGGDSSTGPSNADPSGLYSLRQVGGDAIPAEIFRGTLASGVRAVVKVTGGELVLQEDGRFYLAMDFRLEANGEVVSNSISVEGNYAIDGAHVTLISDDGVNGAEATLRKGAIAVGLDLVGDGVVKQYTFRYVP